MTGTENNRRFRVNRLFSALIGGVALILATWLIIRCGIILLNNSHSGNAGSPGAVLLIETAEQQNGQFRLFKTGLAAAGLASETLILPDNWTSGEPTADQLLQLAVTDLAETVQCDESQIWLATAGKSTAIIWGAACRIRNAAGLLLFVPRDLEQLSTAQIQQWPDDRPLAVFSGEAASVEGKQPERLFFETLTGEDSTIFPGYQVGYGQPIEFTAADGKTWLGLYPMLAPNWALSSPRVLPDATSWLADWTADSQTTGRYRLAARLMTEIPFQLLLAGLLLLAALTSLNLFLVQSDNRAEPFRSISPPAVIPVRWLGEIVVWLPAIALSGGAGWLVSWSSGSQIETLFISLAILPGCHGWVWLLWKQIGNRRRHQVRPVLGLLRHPAWLAGLTVPVGLLLLAAIWSVLSLGMDLVSFRQWALLIILIIIGWPAGLAGTCGQIGERLTTGTRLVPRISQTIWQHLPFLVLPILAFLRLGWTGLAAGMLLLTIHFWSTGLGKAATLISRRPLAGSLIQSAGYALGVLMPPVLMGFQGFIK